MIPLLVDLTGRSVIVCGGGDVAARKVAFFLPEADVTVVSRSFVPGLREAAVRRVEADLDRYDDAALQALVAEADLVVAATSDPALNARITQAARETGALANSATGGGNVQLPAVSRGERYLVAVTTGGESPGVARFLREALEAAYPHLDRMIGLQARLRHRLFEKLADQRQRSLVLRSVLEDPDVWAALDHGDDRAWALVEERYLHA